MLPSMPILFARDSQDAFGNKIQPSTSVFVQNFTPITGTKQRETPTQLQRETKINTDTRKCMDQEKNNLTTNKDLKEMVLVNSYFSKVKSRFAANSNQPTNKFVQFRETLKTFDPCRESAVDLYRRIEMLFGDENKDLTEDFLLFLTPAQAQEINRFMDHFTVNRMSNFIELLQNSFGKNPPMLRKVIRAITKSLNCGSADEMKATVLPHLRSNPKLVQMFKSLFPDERPPESLYNSNTDIINESFLTNDQGYDIWEFEDTTGNRKNLNNKEGFDSVYVQGRIFLKHGRMVRSARVTFPYSKEPYRVHARRLAPSEYPLSPSPRESDDERASPRRNVSKNPKNATNKSRKSQRKSLNAKTVSKDVNDNTKHANEATKATDSPKASKSNKHTDKLTSRHEKIDIKDSKHTKHSAKDKAESIKTTDRNHTHKRYKQKDKKKDEGTKSKQAKFHVEVKNKMKFEQTSWTRDEDKTMLQILKGEAGSDQIFGKVRELLPHRSLSDIKERFLHVMTLLQQMAVGEVT